MSWPWSQLVTLHVTTLDSCWSALHVDSLPSGSTQSYCKLSMWCNLNHNATLAHGQETKWYQGFIGNLVGNQSSKYTSPSFMTSQKGRWNTFSINCILDSCNSGALYPSYKIRTVSGIFYNTPMPGPHLQKVSLIDPGAGYGPWQSSSPGNSRMQLGWWPNVPNQRNKRKTEAANVSTINCKDVFLNKKRKCSRRYWEFQVLSPLMIG